MVQLLWVVLVMMLLLLLLVLLVVFWWDVMWLLNVEGLALVLLLLGNVVGMGKEARAVWVS